MKFKSSDYYLWFVPARDGHVHKVRVTFARAATISILIGAFLGGVVFLAGDYARVELMRAKNYVSLQLAERERNHLLLANQQLESQLRSLRVNQGRVLSYEQSVRQRLDELADVLRSSAALGAISLPKELESPKAKLKRGIAKSLSSKSEGVGGAELDCSAPDKPCAAYGPMSDPDEQPLRLGKVSPVAFLDSNSASDPLLVKRLDDYIALLKQVPLGLPAVGHVSSRFGYRYSPFGEGVRLHEGMDFALLIGDFVYGTADGVVKEVRRCSTYGLMVDIQHSDHVVTRYAHLSKALVSEGEKICRGEVIGLAGSSGHSTGPHLHYEVRVNNIARDPSQFIRLAEKLAPLAHG